MPCPRPVLATGGHLKAVFALGRPGRAILSQHLGDLDGYDAFRAYTEELLSRLQSVLEGKSLEEDAERATKIWHSLGFSNAE